jgi:eukaryotic-like serine/threonine-protein kinase
MVQYHGWKVIRSALLTDSFRYTVLDRPAFASFVDNMLMKKRTSSRHAAGAPRDGVLPGSPGGIAKEAARGHSGARRAPKALAPTTLEETVVHASPGTRRSVSKAPESEVEADSLLGRKIGQYQIESIVGRGSMARVYKARHLGLGRHCALKVMDPALDVEQPGIREQFWAEARAAANLIHPHIVTIHNLGSLHGLHFIEMEYVPGGLTLRDSLVREGPLEPLRATMLAKQVGLALQAAHDAGLVHRDVKPANVLLTPDGRAKLTDFGLVRRLEDLAQGSAPLAGTPTFMAPELFRGTPASPQSDIYALGVMLFHTLSGRLPFIADNIHQIIQLHQHQPIPHINETVAVPDALEAILQRCLAKSPADRYTSARELADSFQLALQRLRDTESLVRESAKGLDCFIQGARDTFRVIIPQPGDRLQEVIIEVTEGKNNEQYLSVFSVCGPADPGYFAYALTLNSHLTFGSISIHDVLGKQMFVMSRTFLRDLVRPEELRDAMVEIARRADSVEKQLTRLDEY